MTHHGIIQHGAIVLDRPVNLPEGASVQVEILPLPTNSPSARFSIAQLAKDISYDPDALRDLREASTL